MKKNEIIKKYDKNESKELICKKCYEKAYGVYGENIPEEIRDRIELELNSIVKNNYQSIYLLNSELVEYSNKLGYNVGIRGSCGCSLVAYLLGITNINSVEFRLPFEIFAGKGYDKSPDIVLNFADEIIEEVFIYLEEKYGNDSRKLFKSNILHDTTLTILHELEKETNINSKYIDLEDNETLEVFCNVNDQTYKTSIKGIQYFDTDSIKNMLDTIKPKNFNELVYIFDLSHGADVWTDNVQVLIERDEKKVTEVISNREDTYNYFKDKGIDKDTAYDIMKFIQNGKATKYTNEEQWDLYKEVLKKHDIPNWYIESAGKISYLFPKSHAIDYTMNAFRLAWFKVYYPKEFYQAYLKAISPSCFDIKAFNSMEYVTNCINELKENHKEKCYYSNTLRVHELALEMNQKGIHINS